MIVGRTGDLKALEANLVQRPHLGTGDDRVLTAPITYIFLGHVGMHSCYEVTCYI